MMDCDYIKFGDCSKLLKNIPDNSIDLIVTDPPYLIENKCGGLYTKEDKKYVKELEDIKNGFSEEILDELCRVMKKINIYIWCSQKQLYKLIDYFVEKHKCNFNLITWHKTNPIPACGNKYLTDTEYCLFFREKGVKIYGNFDTKFTYYVTPLNSKDKKQYKHPTIKPLNIIKNLVINSSNEGDIVLDPFIGSGTTAIACKETNRHYIGFEINKNYFEIANKRLNEVGQNIDKNIDKNIQLKLFD